MTRCARPLSGLSRLLVLVALAASTAAAQTPSIPTVGSASTFDAATWNVERFGNSSAGPSNDQLQLDNATEVVRQSGIDLWALQEINDPADFNTLVDNLAPDYEGLLGPSVSSSSSFDLRLAYLYDPDVVTILESGEVTEGLDSFDFASGRFPFQIRAEVSVPGAGSFELYVLDLHLLSGDTSSDYGRRVNASQQLKGYVDDLRAGGAEVMILGDFNDELIESITPGRVSPYLNFLSDDDYVVLTEPLDQPGGSDDENTFCFNTSCSSGSVIDHLFVTAGFGEAYVAGSVATHSALLDAFDAFGGEFVSTTSDHLPVYARFDLTVVPNEPSAAPRSFALGTPFPNPFNDVATVSYSLDRSGPVQIELFDALGRRVALIEDDARPAGTYRVRFNASALTPGLYIVRLTSGDRVATRRLVRAEEGRGPAFQPLGAV